MENYLLNNNLQLKFLYMLLENLLFNIFHQDNSINLLLYFDHYKSYIILQGILKDKFIRFLKFLQKGKLLN